MSILREMWGEFLRDHPGLAIGALFSIAGIVGMGAAQVLS